MTSFDRKSLLNAIRTVSSVIPSRTPQPVLESVLLKCRDNTATLTATDSECRVNVNVECDGEDFETLIPSGQVSSLLSAMSSETVTISEGKNRVVITDQSGTYTIPTRDIGEFPENAFPIELTFSTDSLYVARSLPMVTSVIVDKLVGGAYYVEGVRFDSIDGKVYLIGTDLNRLCACRLGDGELEPFTLSLKVAGLLSKMQGKISIGCKNGVVSMVSDGMSITSRTMIGTFPKWKPLTDTASKYEKLEAKLPELIEGLRKTSVFTNPESKGVTLSVEKDATKLTSFGLDKGQCGVEISGGSLTTGPIKLHGELLAGFLEKVPKNLPVTMRVGDKFVVEVSDYCRFFMGLMEI